MMKSKICGILFLTVCILQSHAALAMGPGRLHLAGRLLELAKQGDPVFDLDEINRIRAQATEKVDQQLESLSGSALAEAAKNYFSDVKTEQGDLIPAYRVEMIVKEFHQLLKQRYPGLILENPKWAWSNVGGAYGRVLILYCSLKEYIGVYGTALPQNSFSGEFKGIDYFEILLSGRMETFGASSEKALPKLFEAGDVSVLKSMETKFYSMDKFTYLINYGRGNIMNSLWQGVLAPFVFNNHDSGSLQEQFKSCSQSISNDLMSKTIRFEEYSASAQ
jgi:hypothetical protein